MHQTKLVESVRSDHTNSDIHEMIATDCGDEDPQDDTQAAVTYGVHNAPVPSFLKGWSSTKHIALRYLVCCLLIDFI